MKQPPIRLVLFGMINAYLVPEQGGLTLMDTGMPMLVPRILNKAAQLGQPIRRVVLTHGHDDHSLGLDAIKQAFPDAEVFVHAADKPYLKLLGLQTQPDRFLHGDEQVGSLRVIAAPGHSEGHLAYFDERDGTLYGGDSFVNVPSLRVVTELHPLFPMPTLGTWDTAQALASAQKLSDLEGLSWLALGHGPLIKNPQQKMKKAVAQAEKMRQPGPLQLALARQINRLMSPAKAHLS